MIQSSRGAMITDVLGEENVSVEKEKIKADHRITGAQYLTK
jgi:hypothetical protein